MNENSSVVAFLNTKLKWKPVKHDNVRPNANVKMDANKVINVECSSPDKLPPNMSAILNDMPPMKIKAVRLV
jgi:hypothetical protein